MYKNHGAISKSLLAAILFIVGLSACKNDTNAAEAADTSAAKGKEAVVQPLAKSAQDDFIARLEKARPGLKVTGIVPTPIENVVRIDLEGAGSVYGMKGTDYFFVGELYQIQESELVNISEKEKEGLRAELMAKISRDDMIVFAPKGEVKKHISVFTDVDCGYCQKLHQEVPELNAMGIEVRYLAYPRAGVGSPAYDKIASAWCADNPQEAMTKLKNREQIPIKVCEGNPVAAQYDLGGQMGVRGTPAIILDDGEMLPGYLPAADLAQRLGI